MNRGKLKIFAPAIIWAVIILAISSIPYLSTPSMEFKIEDKIAHFGEYLVLGVLLAHGFSRQRWGPGKVFLASAGIAGLFGILDEIHQLIIPGRQMDALDILADVAGSCCAAGIYVIITRKRLQS
jgi:VanZ family protein